MATIPRIPGQPPHDLRALLIRAGAGQYTADMSIPYMNFLPTTTEPYAQGVQQIVQGLQRLLNEKGARLRVDGGFGERTIKALMVFAGPRWYDKSWAQLYNDVLSGHRWEGWQRNDRTPHLELAPWEAQGGVVGDVFDSPLLLIGLGALAWWWFTKPGGGRERVRSHAARARSAARAGWAHYRGGGGAAPAAPAAPARRSGKGKYARWAAEARAR